MARTDIRPVVNLLARRGQLPGVRKASWPCE
jgi:ribosomal protein S14